MRKLFGLFLIVAVVAIFSNVSVHAQSAPAWAANTPYAVGNLVTYGGGTYKCLQAHTSQIGWEPPNVPALWTLQSGNAPTATAGQPTFQPRTNTPGPSATISVPTATSSGTCTVAAYNNATIYTIGQQASYNGHLWQAKWWTQGEVPSTGGSGVWLDQGSCTGGPITNTPVASKTSTGPLPTATNTNIPPTTGPGGNVILGYFAEWGVYGRNYHVKNLVTSGSAAKLTHINYAFGNVQNGACVLGDTYADYDRSYDAASSVSGAADTYDAGALRGSFHQLQELKVLYPNIKVIFSFGGWTWSGGFTQAAQNATAFANSCYNLLHDARWNGVFDGIDIDWEYPNACGLQCDTSGPQAYVNLMAALRARFGSELVTSAVGAGSATINASDYGTASQYVNWFNVMSYDFFGAFNATGPTAPHSPLYTWPGMPTANGQDKFTTDAAIQLFKSKGIPAKKLLIGLGFYGRGWTGVPNINGGLNQSASGAAHGTYENGIEDYKVLVNTCPSTGMAAGTAYAYCGGNWWSYDTPTTIAGKMGYAKNQGLGGAFFWEFSGDTSDGVLISAIYNNR